MSLSQSKQQGLASLLGALVFHVCDSGYASVFGEDFAQVPLAKGDSIFTNCRSLEQTEVGGSTNTYNAIKFLHSGRNIVDPIIIFTDMIVHRLENENCDTPQFIYWLEKYRRQVNPKVKTYIINLQPYEYFISPADDLGVSTISGWSESLLKYIEYDSSGYVDMVEVIRRIIL